MKSISRINRTTLKLIYFILRWRWITFLVEEDVSEDGLKEEYIKLYWYIQKYFNEKLKIF